MIDKKGFYLDQFDRVWELKEDKYKAILTLSLYNKDAKKGFYRSGKGAGFTDVTKIVKYLEPSEYPEYYI